MLLLAQSRIVLMRKRRVPLHCPTASSVVVDPHHNGQVAPPVPDTRTPFVTRLGAIEIESLFSLHEKRKRKRFVKNISPRMLLLAPMYTNRAAPPTTNFQPLLCLGISDSDARIKRMIKYEGRKYKYVKCGNHIRLKVYTLNKSQDDEKRQINHNGHS